MAQYGDLERLKARIGPELAKLRADQRQAGHRCAHCSLPEASGHLPARQAAVPMLRRHQLQMRVMCGRSSMLLLCISRLRYYQGLSWKAQRRSVAG